MAIKPILSKDYIKDIKDFYYNKGYSAREIAEEINVSLDVVYKFMRRHGLKRRTFHESNFIRFEKQEKSFFIKNNLTQKEKQLKIAGIMLYWAEGGKSNPKNRSWTVDMANSNSEMISLFLKFLRNICGVDEKRLRCLLYCYADQDIEGIKKYWSGITKIPLKQFSKPYVRKDFLTEKSGKMKYGLVHVRYSDKKLLLQIEKWIKEYAERI